jgi:replication-associated recombination protein RarA
VTTTQSGYEYYELLSALQKSIRRGLEEQALIFALELEGFNQTALWNRLKVIASEDIGFANPLMSVLIETLHKQYLNEGLDNSRLRFLSNAIVCLCKSPKTRIADDLLNVVQIEDKHPSIPDYALDGIHTRRATKEGREEWDKVENEALPNPYRERLKQLRKV